MPLTVIEVALTFGEIIIYAIDIFIIYPAVALFNQNLNPKAQSYRNCAFFSFIISIIIILVGIFTNNPTFSKIFVPILIASICTFYMFTILCALNSDTEKPQLRKRPKI